MRPRHHFVPVLDGMPYRIAPSAVSSLAVVATPMPTPQTSTGSLAVATADTDPPLDGPSGPIIIAPVSNPTTLPC